MGDRLSGVLAVDALEPVVEPSPTRRLARPASPTTEPRWVQVALILLALAFLLSFLLLPLVLVFTEALRGGVGAFVAAVTEPDALAAVKRGLRRKRTSSIGWSMWRSHRANTTRRTRPAVPITMVRVLVQPSTGASMMA